ncbi:MAG: DMT family transporter [Gemmobacter sp.]
MPRLGPNTAGAMLSLAAFAVFASHDALIKALSARYSVIQIVFCIALFGCPLLLAMLARDPAPETLRPRHPRLMLLRAATVAGSFLFGFYAFSVLPMAQVYAILFATPLLVTLFAVPVLGEPVGPRRILAVIAGFAGVLIVLRPGAEPIAPGHVAALAAAVCGAVTSVVARKVGGTERPAVLMLYGMAGNFVLMGLAIPFVYVPMPGPDMAVMIAIALLGFLAMRLIIAAYRLAEAAIVAPMQYSQILWAVFFGAMFFDEWPDAATFGGAAVVIGSGLYIVLRETRVAAVAPVTRGTPRPEAAPPEG